MAHKTRINGTAYEISGGRTLVNGTGYSVESGRTLVNGTGYDIDLSNLPPIGTSLNNMTWEEVRAVSDAGLAANYFAVGDRKEVALSNTTVGYTSVSGTYYCYILGIDHNSSREGTNRIHFQFGYTALSDGVHIAFIDVKNTSVYTGNCFHMNNDNTSDGGWSSSYARNTLCPQLKSALPSDLQSVLKTVTKMSDNVGDTANTASHVTETTDTIFLLAEFEVLGKRTYANSAESSYQAQYAFYITGSSTRVRYGHNQTSTKVLWWLRSNRVGGTGFCAVNMAGAATYAAANYSRGFAPAFCV